MTVLRAQSKIRTLNDEYVNSINVTLDTPVSAGSVLLAFFSGGTQDAMGNVTDSNGNTWQLLDQRFNDINTAVFVCKNANAGATTVYGQTSGGYHLLSMTVIEYTGVSTTQPIAQYVYSSTEAYLNQWTRTLTPINASTRAVAYLGTSNISDYTAYGSSENVIDADSPSYTGAVSCGYEINGSGNITIGFNLSGYNRGTIYGIELQPAAGVTPPPAQSITASGISAPSPATGSPTLTLGTPPNKTITASTVGNQSAIGTPAVNIGTPAAKTITVGTIADASKINAPTLTLPIPVQSISATSIGDQSEMSNGALVADASAVQKTETFVDLFDQGIDETVWDKFGGIYSEGGLLRIEKPAGADYYGIRSIKQYNLYNSFAYMQLVDAGDVSQPTWEVTPIMLSSDDNSKRVYITISANSILAWLLVDGDYQVQAQIPYDKNAHKWFRIRESAGTLYYEYSRAGVDWGLIAAVATPSQYYFDMSLVHIQIQAGDYTNTSPANSAYIDNLNPPITDSQAISAVGGIDAPRISNDGSTLVYDPGNPTIAPRTISDQSAVGTPLIDADLILHPVQIPDYGTVGTPTVNGQLRPNDTAPTYAYFRRTFLPIRDINANIAISFQRGYAQDADFFVVGSSAFDSGDVFQGNGTAIQEFDRFNYDDYSRYIDNIQYHQEQDIIGSMVMGYADVTMVNKGGLFSPYDNSPIADLILPNRPMKIMAGFGNQSMQIFVGQTEKLPDVTADTAKFHAKDFIKSFSDKKITGGRIYVNMRTDQIIDDILIKDAGLSPVQYDLDQGLNTVGFMAITADQSIGDVVRKLCEAEQGRLYQNNLGRMIFKNRLNKLQYTPIVISQENVFSEKEPEIANVINQVTIESDVRQVQPLQQVFPNLKEGSLTEYDDFQSIEIKAGQTVEQFFNMDDPVTSYTHPSGTNLVANSKSDGTGTAKTSKLTLTVLAEFTDSVKYSLYNSDTASIYVTVLKIKGTPAKVVNEIRINVLDQNSIDKYGVNALDIPNDYFTNQAFALATANQILAANSEAPLTREVTIKGIPYMQVGDVIRYYDGFDYVIDIISGQISKDGGNTQDVTMRKL